MFAKTYVLCLYEGNTAKWICSKNATVLKINGWEVAREGKDAREFYIRGWGWFIMKKSWFPLFFSPKFFLNGEHIESVDVSPYIEYIE